MNAVTTAKPMAQATPETRFFWDGCAAGELRIQRCNACDRLQFYPRAVCVSCLSTKLTWQISSGFGTIYSFTHVHRAPSAAFDPDVPYGLALVDLDEGIRIMGNVLGAKEGEMSIGSRVRVVFEIRQEMALPQFELVEG